MQENLIGIEFLSTAQVIELHDEQIDLHGGIRGTMDFNLVDSAVESPKSQFGGLFLYPDIHLMAAAYMFSLVCNHGFRDGNHRTAAQAVFVFYYLNGFLLEISEDDLVDFAVMVGEDKPTRLEIAAVLRKHISALPVED